MNFARLMLNRPRQPDAKPTLHLLRELRDSPADSRLLPSRRDSLSLLRAYLTRTVEVLKAHENEEDLAWVNVLLNRHLDGEFLDIAKEHGVWK